MKNLLLGIAAVCMLVSTSAFASQGANDIKEEVKVASTDFKVKVNSGTTALGGATVKVFQGGDMIASGVTTDRGLVELSVPNQEAITLQISAKGHVVQKKENIIPADGEIIPISLEKSRIAPVKKPPVKK